MSPEKGPTRRVGSPSSDRGVVVEKGGQTGGGRNIRPNEGPSYCQSGKSFPWSQVLRLLGTPDTHCGLDMGPTSKAPTPRRYPQTPPVVPHSPRSDQPSSDDRSGSHPSRWRLSKEELSGEPLLLGSTRERREGSRLGFGVDTKGETAGQVRRADGTGEKVSRCGLPRPR